MVQMKFSSMSCLMGLFLLATACSSTEEDALAGGGASGSVKISISADTSFGATTKAVDESEYKNADNYTVQILNSAGNVATDAYDATCEYKGSTLPGSIELNNGSYTAKAFYGEEHDVSRDAFYVVGTKTFNINGGEVTTPVEITCEPTCGKLITEFDETMADYFSSYYVIYNVGGSSSSFFWDSGDTAPYYVKVDESGEEVKASIHFTRKSDNLTSTVEKTFTLQRNKAWKLYIAPDVTSGELGITITIDSSLNEQDIEIVVPAEWV